MGAKPLQHGTYGRRTSVVRGLRLTKDEAEAVDAAAKKAGQSFSSFTREALVRQLVFGDMRLFVDRVASRLHAQARALIEEAKVEDRKGGSGVRSLEHAAVLQKVGDALLAAVGEDPDEGAA
jgi:hypothetical protein